MRIFFLIVFGLFTFIVNAQKETHNVKSDNVAVQGYDVVSYFKNKAIKGKNKYIYSYKRVKYKFSTKENLEEFKLNPTNYLPQYGGWCAYAMGTTGEKVSINPKTFEIRKGKLYLFYNAYFTNTLDNWQKENPEKLKKKANKNWEKFKNR